MQRHPTQAHQERPAAGGCLLDMRDRTAVRILLAMTAASAAGFVYAPPALTGAAPTHGQGLTTATTQAFTAYWRSERRAYPPRLAELVAYGRRYHVAKAVFALALAILLSRLAVILWHAVRRPGQRRPATTGGGVLSASAATSLAFGSALVVTANIQGIFAPFSSLMSLLPIGHGGPALATTDAQIRHDLASGQAQHHAPATLHAILEDFARYHAVLAVQAAALAVLLLGLAVRVVRHARTPPTADHPRVIPRLLGAELAALAVLALVLCAANTSTALNPAPALRLFFGG